MRRLLSSHSGPQTQVEIRSLEQQQAVAEYARMALGALGDVENALAATRALSERQPLLEQAVADNQRALDLAQTNYRIGHGDLRAVQQQQLNLHAARLALLRVQSEQLAQRVNLHLSLGGSFEPTSVAEANLTIERTEPPTPYSSSHHHGN